MSEDKIDVEVVIPEVEKKVTLELELKHTLTQLADFLKKQDLISTDAQVNFYKISGKRPIPLQLTIAQVACRQKNISLIAKRKTNKLNP